MPRRDNFTKHDGHSHSHKVTSNKEAQAYLEFTLKHNRAHEEELTALAHDLDHLGLSAAAEEVRNSLEDSKCASEHIQWALEAIEA
ncbi:MAG: hypothetical protein LBQ91_02305 [Oscillospiraceae bacterium]|nr:hypothetical protein [Oscillospiraceae bacterium]